MSEKNVNYGWLKDYDGNEFIPITHSTKVYDNDGKTVEERLSSAEQAIDDLEAQEGFKNIKAGSTTIVADTAEDTLEIAAGTGISVVGDATNDKVTIGHSNTVTAKTSFAQTTDADASEENFTVSELTYDAQGHITGKQDKKITLPKDISGNAATASKLKTPITVTITDNNGHNGNATTFDGSSAATLDLPDTITANIEDKDGEYFFIDKNENVVAKINASGFQATDVTTPKTSLNALKDAFDDLSDNVITEVIAGSGLAGGGSTGSVTLDVNVDRGLSIVNDKIGHSYTADTNTTSTVNPGYGKTFTVVDSVTKDTYGHVTKVNTKTVTMPSAQTVNNAKITIQPGTGLTTGGDFTVNQSADEIITLNHSNSITAGTAKGSDTKTLKHGDTFTIPTITYDAQGHITGKGTTTMTMPAMPTPGDLGLTKAMIFLGTTTTPLIDGIATKPIIIDGKNITQTNGNVVLYSGKEFVWSEALGVWEELGDEGSHALKTIEIIAGDCLNGGGTLEQNRTINHDALGPDNGYTSGNTTTSISGSGGSGTIKIPQLTVDKYGHVTVAADESITITMPSSVTGNAGTADKWKTARNISIADSNKTNTGTAVSVDGSENETLLLPATIKATLTGNADTATKLKTTRKINGTDFDGSADITTAKWGTARNISITDNAGHTGTATEVDGSGNISLDLPDTIVANIESPNGEYIFIDNENNVAVKISKDGIETTDIKTSKTSLNALKDAFDTIYTTPVSTTKAGVVPVADAALGTIDNQTNDWVLTKNDNGTIDWYKLPANAFKDTTYEVANTSAAGLAQKLCGDSTKYYRGDGAWAVPPDTKYTAGDGLTLTGTKFEITTADASEIINKLGEGTSEAKLDDYLVAQYAGGGETTTTYHRRKVSNVVNATVVKNALGTGTGTTKYLREDGTWQTPVDTKVTQKAITTNKEYPIILANSEENTEKTDTVNKTDSLKYNPSTKVLTAGNLNLTSQSEFKFIDKDGNVGATINKDGIVTSGDVSAGSTSLKGLKTSFDALASTKNTKTTNGLVPAPGAVANKVWKTDASGNPGWRDDVDTTYSAATQSVAGLMAAADKKKLDGIATGAEVNQNAFSNVKVGSTTIAADAKTDTLELVASTNVTITPDATNDKVTISALDEKVKNEKATTTKAYVTGTTSSSTNTGTQVFDTGVYLTETASQLHVGSLEVATSLLPDAIAGADIGTADLPWDDVNANSVIIRDDESTNTNSYVTLTVATEGINGTAGVGRLTLGNKISKDAEAAAGNAEGQILMYGENSGYTVIKQNNNTASNITITLPDNSGTLATIGNIGAGTGMNKVTDGDAITLNVNAGTGLTANSDNITLNTATDSALGGVKLSDSYTSSNSLPAAASGGTAATPRAVQLVYAQAMAAIETVDESKMALRPHYIELAGSSDNTLNEGYIDFHYNNDSGDYTSRIIEAQSGMLDINGVTITKTDSTGTIKANLEVPGAEYIFVDKSGTSSAEHKGIMKIDSGGLLTTEVTIAQWNNSTSKLDTICTMRGLNDRLTTTESQLLNIIQDGSNALVWGTDVTLATVNGVAINAKLPANPNIDTKNTAGTTNKTGTKLYLAGATEQGTNPITYSNSNVYIGTDNCLYSNGKKVLTDHITCTDGSNALSWGTNITLATIGGVTIDAKLPNNPNTHYTTNLYATSSSGTANAATTNDNTYLKLFDDTTARSAIKIKGSGATTVTSDANGVITISSSDNNTDTKVKQNAAIETNNEYPIILGYSNTLSEVTNAVNKTSTLTYNPSTRVLSTGNLNLTEQDEFYFTDTSGNVNAIIDQHGIETTRLTANRIKVDDHRINIYNPSIPKGTVPTETAWHTIHFGDSSESELETTRLGMVASRITTEGQAGTSLYSYHNQAGSSSKKYLGVFFNQNGTNYAATDAQYFSSPAFVCHAAEGYGTTLPETAVVGQVFFQIIEGA